jgi:glycosyltransferase involved in cell wall biosynthesis
MARPSPARIALDATLWDAPTTGIGLYVRELGRALERLGVTVERFGAPLTGAAPRRGIGRSLWTVGGLPGALSRSGAQLYHAAGNFNLPLTRTAGKAYVLTVHDLIPELLPDTVSRAFRWQFRLWLSRSAQLADRIICVSARTREDFLSRYELDADRVVVVHHGADHVDAVPAPDAVGERYLDSLGLPERFVLYAGSLDARKNVTLVLDAAFELKRRGRPCTVVLAGQSWFGAGAVERRLSSLRADGLDVRPLGYLEAPLFYGVMRRACAFAFPSRYEGFGLPPLEAMRLGVPCVVSTAGSLPEVCGDGALYVDPDDAGALCGALDRLLSSDVEHRRLSDAGRRHAARFTWEAAAQRTRAVYADAVAEAGAR